MRAWMSVLETHQRIAEALGATVHDEDIAQPGVGPVRHCWIQGSGWRTSVLTHLENPTGPRSLVVTIAGRPWLHPLGTYPKDAAGEVLTGDAYITDRVRRIRQALEAIGPAMRADVAAGQQMGLGL